MSKGFTLLELMVVLTVAGVLMALALPQFRDTGLAASRARGATSLFAALNQARSEAVARNKVVTVCKRSRDPLQPSTTCVNGSGDSWAQGWIIRSGTADTDVIAVFDPIGNVPATTGNDEFKVLTELAATADLEFEPNGRLKQSARLTFTLCDRTARLKDSRRITVAISGGVSLEQLSAADTVTACAS